MVDADLAWHLFNDDSTSRFNDQFVVRLFNGEKVLVVAESNRFARSW